MILSCCFETRTGSMGQGGGNRWERNAPGEDDFCLNKFIKCEMNDGN